MNKQLDLLIINAPGHEAVYQGLAALAACEPPVWAGLIAQAARRQNFSVDIVDAEAEQLNAEETAEKINERNPLLAVFSIYGHQPSASTQRMPGAIATMKKVKAGIPTLAMGTHPSALPRKTLAEGFTFVCEGEGLLTILPLLVSLQLMGTDAVRSLAPGNLPSHLRPPGLWFKDKFGAVAVPTAPLIQNLDEEMPSQAWDLLPMANYHAHNWHLFGRGGAERLGYASIQTSLGCPFKCSFCCINAPFGKSGIRYWSPKNIGAQIERLVEEYNITNIKIPDEMFVLNRQHVLSICDEIDRRGYGKHLNIWAYARVDTVKDTEMLSRMRASGFRWLGIGIESGSKHVRDGVEKGRFDEEAIITAVDRVQGLGIHVAANYIFGLPDDTLHSMQDTLTLARELNTEWANFYCAMAYPGSPLHTTALERGWRLPEGPGGPGWIGYAQHAYQALPLRTEVLTHEEILDFRDDAHLIYFTSKRYEDMLEHTFGGEAVAGVRMMVALGKPRRAHRDQLNLAGRIP